MPSHEGAPRYLATHQTKPISRLLPGPLRDRAIDTMAVEHLREEVCR
jgi:hypothetical protein